MMASTAMTKEETVSVTAEAKWAASDHFIRGKMLSIIGWSQFYVTSSWKKLPHMIKVNLASKTWTK